MDEKDRMILQKLKGNARISWQELGDAIGLTRVGAKKRVDRLEKEGIIRGYNTCIYREDEVRAYITVTTTTEEFDNVLRYVSTETTWVRQIFRLYKENTILMVAAPPSSEDLRYMARMIMKQTGVANVRVDQVAEVIKDVYGGVRRYEDVRKPRQGEGLSEDANTGDGTENTPEIRRD